MVTLLIRDALSSDLPVITDLYNELAVATFASYRDKEVDLANRILWWQDLQDKGFPVFVAEDDGQVIAYSSYGDFRAIGGYRTTVEHTIWVSAAGQGKGIARLLMDKLFEHAKNNRIHLMVAVIDADNARSLNFHKALGFVEVGRMPEVAYVYNTWRESVFMQRVIAQK